MCSTFEGFSLAVLEGMALQMPMLLSDIASFREQCEDTAEYFKLDDVNDFINKLRILKTDKSRREQMGKASKERALANFTQEHYMAGLRNIYTESL
jgi:glycosyltransferase involved in cell wall biosynthesis